MDVNSKLMRWLYFKKNGISRALIILIQISLPQPHILLHLTVNVNAAFPLKISLQLTQVVNMISRSTVSIMIQKDLFTAFLQPVYPIHPARLSQCRLAIGFLLLRQKIAQTISFFALTHVSISLSMSYTLQLRPWRISNPQGKRSSS